MRALLIPALLAVSAVLHASQEGVIAFSNLHFESLWPQGSSPVIVDALQDAKGMQRFSVQAFGRSYQLTTSQLRDLGAGLYNSIQVSGEGGNSGPGGSIIYIKVSMGFVSSEQGRSKYVVIKESGTIEVRDQLPSRNTP